MLSRVWNPRRSERLRPSPSPNPRPSPRPSLCRSPRRHQNRSPRRGPSPRRNRRPRRPTASSTARSFGMDVVWFGVITVVAVEIGLLTPPFGVSVYTVKAALNDSRITIRDIFAGSFPFVLMMCLVLLLLVMFPSISTWLAYL